MSKWIRFYDAGTSPSGKTRQWNVISTKSNTELGYISWCGQWRKYAFSPAQHTSYDEDCLRDIADFCESQTKEHKRLKHAAEHEE